MLSCGYRPTYCPVDIFQHVVLWVPSNILSYRYLPTCCPVGTVQHIVLWISSNMSYAYPPTYCPIDIFQHVDLWVPSNILSYRYCPTCCPMGTVQHLVLRVPAVLKVASPHAGFAPCLSDSVFEYRADCWEQFCSFAEVSHRSASRNISQVLWSCSQVLAMGLSSEWNPLCIYIHHLFKIYFNFVLSTTFRSPRWFISFRVSVHFMPSVSHVCAACYITLCIISVKYYSPCLQQNVTM
jgi:hypothetical protein